MKIPIQKPGKTDWFIDSRVINQSISCLIYIFTEYLAKLFFHFVVL